MHIYEKTIIATVERRELPAPGSRVVVAVSGGADSVALLAAMMTLGYDCVAAHCNFHLRGEESMRDMHFVSQLAAELGCELHIQDFDVEARCRQTGESVEMACRELRYAWFNELADSSGATAIAVGHHSEDSVETFMLNLLRGSGIAGLAGIPYSTRRVMRPALDTTRQMIEDYLQYRRLSYVTDSTNLTCDYARNAIRLRLLPLLEELRPGAMQTISRSISNLLDCRQYIEEQARAARIRYDYRGKLNVYSIFANEGPTARILLYEILRHDGFNMTHVDDIYDAADRGSSGIQFISTTGMVAELDRGLLAVGRPHAESKRSHVVDITVPITNPVKINVSRHSVEDFNAEHDARVMYIDSAALDGEHRWELRRPRRGDRLEPFGMKGSKLLSDLMTEARYSAADKRRAWVLTRDDVPVWVPGLRAWRHFPVTHLTKTYLRLQYVPE